MNFIKKILLTLPPVRKILAWKHAYFIQEQQQNIRLNSIGTTNEEVRLAWTKEQLQKLPAGLRILDAGAGERKFKPYCKHLQYVSQDFGQYNGQGNQEGLQTSSWNQENLDIVCDIIAIPEPDQSFDAILCTEVIEHIPDAALAIKEFGRLLKPNGILIMTAPFCSLTHFAPYHFSTGFSKYYYEHHLAAQDFAIKELTPNGNYFEYLAQEVHRIQLVAEQYTKEGLTEDEALAQKTLLHALSRFSQQDKLSNELLCFGYLVVAVKK